MGSSSDLTDESIFQIKITRFISERALSQSATKLVPKNSILIVSRVGVGKVAIAKEDICTSQDFTNLVLHSGNHVFFAYLIKTKTNKLLEFNQGTSIKGFVKSDLEVFEISVPCIPEQTKIANFLTAIDEKISQLTQKFDLLTQYKKGVMQQIFSQQIRFKDDDGREFPEWEESTVGEMVAQKSKKFDPQKEKENFRCIELEHLSQGAGELLGYTDSRNQKSIKNKFQKGDVLFGKLRPYLRKFLKTAFDGVCSTEIWVLTGKKVSNDFVYQFVQTKSFLTLANISSGSKMPRADWSMVASGEVKFPSVAEQTKIANFLTTIDDKITHTQAQLAAMKQYKQGLLQQMFV